MIFSTNESLEERFIRYLLEKDQTVKRRAEAGINIRAILSGNQEGIDRAEKDRLEKRKTVFVNPQKYNFVPEIDVYDNKIMIASWKEQLGIIIESEEIADAMKKIYDLAWIGAEYLKNN